MHYVLQFQCKIHNKVYCFSLTAEAKMKSKLAQIQDPHPPPQMHHTGDKVERPAHKGGRWIRGGAPHAFPRQSWVNEELKRSPDAVVAVIFDGMIRTIQAVIAVSISMRVSAVLACVSKRFSLIYTN